MAPRPSKLKEKQLNEDGEIINWDSNWEDAVKLRDVLFDGRIDMDATAKAIQEAHPDRQVHEQKLHGWIGNDQSLGEERESGVAWHRIEQCVSGFSFAFFGGSSRLVRLA